MINDSVLDFYYLFFLQFLAMFDFSVNFYCYLLIVLFWNCGGKGFKILVDFCSTINKFIVRMTHCCSPQIHILAISYLSSSLLGDFEAKVIQQRHGNWLVSGMRHLIFITHFNFYNFNNFKQEFRNIMLTLSLPGHEFLGLSIRIEIRIFIFMMIFDDIIESSFSGGNLKFSRLFWVNYGNEIPPGLMNPTITL